MTTIENILPHKHFLICVHPVLVVYRVCFRHCISKLAANYISFCTTPHKICSIFAPTTIMYVLTTKNSPISSLFIPHPDISLMGSISPNQLNVFGITICTWCRCGRPVCPWKCWSPNSRGISSCLILWWAEVQVITIWRARRLSNQRSTFCVTQNYMNEWMATLNTFLSLAVCKVNYKNNKDKSNLSAQNIIGNSHNKLL